MKHYRTIQSIPYFTKWLCGAPLRVGWTTGAIVLLLLLLTGGTAQAQSCTTTVTTAADSGAGSLRTALGSTAANGTICFDATFNTPQTITLASGLSITRSLTISGTGVDNLVLSGNNAVRVISVTTGVNVTLKNLTVRDGFVVNQAGGGIYSSGALTLTAVNILSSTVGTGAVTALGGALHVTGTLVYSGGLVSGNTAYRGGGVYVNGGRATLTGVDIFTNTSTSYGGGLYSKGALTVSATAMISNAAAASGARAGGIYLDGGAA
jgi:predicted outer membrane repeat protein